MKICLILQRRFAYVGHQLAVNLQEKYGINQFCAYVYKRESFEFLNNQKDIQYSSLLLDEDIHKEYEKVELDLEYIKHIEDKYGLPNLWPFIELDRIIRFNQLVREYPYDKPKYSHEEMMKMVQVRAKVIEEMLQKEKPDIVLTAIIGGIGSYLLYSIAKTMNIKTVFVSTARIGIKHTLSEDHSYFTEVDELFVKLQKENKKSKKYQEAKELVNKFREKPITYEQTLKDYIHRISRFKQVDFLKPSKLFRYFKWLFLEIKQATTSKVRHDYDYVHPWGKFKDQIKRKIRSIIGVYDLYDEISPDEEDYAFFPLHLEPEITTLLYAPFYTDQLNLIKQVAKSLPLNFKLYVKEQPAMVDYRPRKFYKELKKIPNVKIVNPKISSFDLIPKSNLITVITGTVGWEATFLGKPVITFGHVFYSKLSFVKRCDNIENLPYLVKDQLNNFKYDEEELFNFLGALLEKSVDVNLSYLWEKETNMEKKRQGLLPLSDFIYDELLNKNE